MKDKLKESEDFESKWGNVYTKHYEDDGPVLVVFPGGYTKTEAEFYIDEEGYQVSKTLEDFEELKEFMRDMEAFVVQLINRDEKA